MYISMFLREDAAEYPKEDHLADAAMRADTELTFCPWAHLCPGHGGPTSAATYLCVSGTRPTSAATYLDRDLPPCVRILTYLCRDLPTKIVMYKPTSTI